MADSKTSQAKVLDAIRNRHVADVQAAAEASGNPGAFFQGMLAGAYYAGYEKGAAAAVGVQATAE